MGAPQRLAIIIAVLILLPGMGHAGPINSPALWHGLYHEPIPETTASPGKEGEAREVDLAVYIPKSSALQGIVVILPGWNHPNIRLIKRSNIKKLADDHGYLLLAPDMGKTLYASRYYPQTRLKWHATPGRRYINRTLLPYLQKKYFHLSSNIFGLGISTGARGMALTAIDHPYLFRAVALLSGDYDQREMPNDKFMRAVYGTYDQFPERRKKDNPLLETPRLRTAVYLAHGTRDPVVPFEQSKLFYDKLSRLGRVRALHFSRPKVGHTYKFWAGQLPDVFSFFGRYRR